LYKETISLMFLQKEDEEEEKKDFPNSPIFIDPDTIP
jgi:hypothetical protein